MRNELSDVRKELSETREELHQYKKSDIEKEIIKKYDYILSYHMEALYIVISLIYCHQILRSLIYCHQILQSNI